MEEETEVILKTKVDANLMMLIRLFCKASLLLLFEKFNNSNTI